MTFDDLKHFIADVMQMSHVYQPVMLITLIEKGGRASVRDIACSILAHDESQIEYYEQITKNMPGPVLRNRGVVGQIGQRRIEGYELLDFGTLNNEQKDELVALCRAKLKSFVERRGEAIWSHRKVSDGYISGTLRYEVLKRAKFRCELCGVSADEKALEVDHIVPRNKGGSDDETNVQALCYSCNAMKRDTDDTDFRDMAEGYKSRQPGCVFCDIAPDRIIDQNELCYAVRDKFPVTPGHSLVIPKRHVADFFGLWQPERNGVNFLLKRLEERIRADDRTVTGFNVGMNCGQDAGQTIFHCHIHLMPRRANDVAHPKGGVRNTLPGQGDYE
jgi:diadenosine tetraphosphate (Ap4A) HIT family hydrolase/5-methylcytosine-specific restriction endonuclease McrA